MSDYLQSLVYRRYNHRLKLNLIWSAQQTALNETHTVSCYVNSLRHGNQDKFGSTWILVFIVPYLYHLQLCPSLFLICSCNRTWVIRCWSYGFLFIITILPSSIYWFCRTYKAGWGTHSRRNFWGMRMHLWNFCEKSDSVSLWLSSSEGKITTIDTTQDHILVCHMIIVYGLL